MNFNNIQQIETDHLFRTFCSFVCLAYNKKYNLANVLLLFLQNKTAKKLFKELLDVDSDVAAVKIFLDFDPSLCKSKYIMKYLNSHRGIH
jgi:hypothetical protein